MPVSIFDHMRAKMDSEVFQGAFACGGGFDSLHRSIDTLRALIPEILTEHIINAIYEKASITCSSGLMDEDLTFDDASSETTSPYIHQQDQQSRKRAVASIFCDQLCGNYKIDLHRNLQDHQEQLFPIIIGALQNLQAFLVKEGKIQNRSCQIGLDKMFWVLAHSKTLPPEICDIFANVVKGLHQITPYQSVTKEEAHILYKSLKRAVSIQSTKSISLQEPRSQSSACKDNQSEKQVCRIPRKIKQEKQQTGVKKEKHQKYELHKQWIPAYEQLLLALYKKTPNISQIRDRFQLVFPKKIYLFSVESLRSKLFKILRAALKRIDQLARESANRSVPPLMKLDDGRVKAIINYHEFRKVRLLILEAYSRGYDLRILYETIDGINHSLSGMEIGSLPHRSHVNVGSNQKAVGQVVSPPLYHPLNDKPVRAKERRLKYNRQFNPTQKGKPGRVANVAQGGTLPSLLK